ncbi:uncharacterized protein LOC113866095 [Abrus precatorius]|uniref:Uncharacterized protein LOC113866095 n=1 Tax=Abrus precatorius TaxID=3816 RepID=A0A8B8LK69_ABRPR|nr:uncharacterized protein LOC113866095 [Abrus precatorius]
MTAVNSATTVSNSNTKAVPPSLSHVFLHEWWLLKQRKGLAVGGVTSMEKARERVFLSAVIAKRHEANVLETEDGITVAFRGFINTSRSCQNGFPSEVCRHFLFGFPYDWKKYSAHCFGDEDIDWTTLFGDSSTRSKESGDDALAFSIPENDFTKTRDSLLSNNNCSTPNNNFNGLGISVGNVCKQIKSTDNMECSIAMKTIECECTDNKLTSNKEIKNDQFSRDRKKQCIGQRTVEDTDNFCDRRVTRSISKRSHAMLNDKKTMVPIVSSPLRRSPRLHYSRK